MEANQYQAIKYHLLMSKYPKQMKTAEEKAKQWYKAKRFIIVESQLFHEKKKGQVILVVQRYQIATILYMIHDYLIREY